MGADHHPHRGKTPANCNPAPNEEAHVGMRIGPHSALAYLDSLMPTVGKPDSQEHSLAPGVCQHR